MVRLVTPISRYCFMVGMVGMVGMVHEWLEMV